MEDDKPVKSVSTPVDEETGRALLQIEKRYSIKPAALTRMALKSFIPSVLRHGLGWKKASK